MLGEKKVAATKTHGKETRVTQRTCLWMAGGVEGYPYQMLEDVNGNGLSPIEIFEFLLSLPRQFASADPRAKQPTFVGFGFSYDMAQILADLPNKNVWEFYTRKKWYRRERGLPNEPSLQGVTLWGGYAVSGKARKYIRLYRLRNSDKWWKEDKNGRKTIDWIERIEIFDVIGFFQTSLLKAIKNFPGLVTKEELEILKRGKADRGRVTKENVAAKMPELKLYTATELKKTALMMELVRLTFETAVPGRPVKLKKWYGPGAVANALLEQHLGKPRDARAKLGDIETPLKALDEEGRRPLMWAFRALFGGRGELMKQGLTGDIPACLRPVVGLSGAHRRAALDGRGRVGPSQKPDAGGNRAIEHAQHVSGRNSQLQLFFAVLPSALPRQERRDHVSSRREGRLDA